MCKHTASIKADLEAVEEILRQQALSSSDKTASEVCEHVRKAGGKRLRPTLVLLSARALGCTDDEPLWAAAAVEMVHTATLLHDDVVDGAKSRRGRQTASALWGPVAAVMSGNILLAKSFEMLVERGQIEFLKRLSEAAVTMCRGELIQNAQRGNFEMDISTYIKIIEQKTADFMSACCEAGAILAKQPHLRGNLSSYGLFLGIAFQMIDDLLDYTGDTTVTGKPIGGDLREGKVTLPLIKALELSTPKYRDQLQRLASLGGALTGEQAMEVASIVASSGAAEAVRKEANIYAEKAVDAVLHLPPNPERDALIDIAKNLSCRTF
ncbi:MAG: polyprenyl synthetase family protein [Armatimonadota bacterium]